MLERSFMALLDKFEKSMIDLKGVSWRIRQKSPDLAVKPPNLG
jgi:hypothetical protein